MTYFVALEGKQHGPISQVQIEFLLQRGKLSLDSLCWHEGMDTWKPLSAVIPELEARPKTDEEGFNPYAPPPSSLAEENQLRVAKGPYGGINRLTYAGISFILGMVNLPAVYSEEKTFGVMLLVALSTAGSVAAVHQRLKNIGNNPLWCFAALIPVVNVVIGLRCLVCPEGYADTRKLDRPGIILAWTLPILLLGAVILRSLEGNAG